MKKYILDFFKYNDWANRKVIEAIKQIPEKNEAINLMCHLINSLEKWTNRLTKEKDDLMFNWMGPSYPVDELESKWEDSVNKWIAFTEKTDNFDEELIFIRPGDEKKMSVKYLDLLLQLNYHSIHHRAQINKIISSQGITPPVTDYIWSKLKEV